MKKSIIIALVLASIASASEDRMAEVPMFGFEKKEVLRDSVSMKAPEKKEMETEKVIGIETPFQKVAWENNRSFNDEFQVVNLGIGF